jgi:hypothetical protein
VELASEGQSFTTPEEVSDAVYELLIGGQLASVGFFPDWRFIPTPDGERAYRFALDSEALARAEARAKAAADQDASLGENVIPLFRAS